MSKKIWWKFETNFRLKSAKKFQLRNFVVFKVVRQCVQWQLVFRLIPYENSFCGLILLAVRPTVLNICHYTTIYICFNISGVLEFKPRLEALANVLFRLETFTVFFAAEMLMLGFLA